MSGWERVVTTFECVRRTVVKSLPCPVCGKKVRRQRTFQQTLNPYNRNPDGSVKTHAEIWAELGKKGLAWQHEPETHTACELGAKP